MASLRRSRARDLASQALMMALAGAVAGCSESTSEAGPVEVRVENASSARFESVTLHTLDGPRIFHEVDPGATTPYILVSRAYRVVTTEAVVARDTLRLQVIDYVGEDPLPPGLYSYVLSVNGLGSSSPSLALSLRRDN